MALLDPRLIELDILSAADRATFGGGGEYAHRRTGTLTPEDRQREEALFGLATERALVTSEGYLLLRSNEPSDMLSLAASKLVYQLVAPGSSVIPLRITQWGRLRLFRLRDEILSGRDRIRDDFGILWAGRHFEPDLTVHLRSRDPGKPISLLVIDVDKLKDLNTDLGHPGANEVLVGIFEELRDGVRPHQGYRTGGDELSAILVDVPLDEATKIANEVRRRVEAREWPNLSFKRHPTVSIGVGTLAEYMDANAFNAAVDRLTYRAKQTRNVVVASPIPEPK